jgi:Flp pilus assembly protein TadD
MRPQFTAEFPHMPRLPSRLTVTAAALSALFVCSGWSLFGSDDDKDSKKPDAPAAQAQQPQAASSAAAQQTAPAEPSLMLPTTSVETEIAKAHALREQGNYDEATKTLGQLMLADPDDARVVGEYGKALAQQGSSKDAIAFLTRAAQLNGSDWTLYSALGVAYDQTDDHKSAHAAYDRALALKPGEPAVLNNYAVSLMLSGDYAGAERMLAQAKAGGDNSPKIASNFAMLAAMKSRGAQSAAAASASHAPAVAAKAPAFNPNNTVMQQVPKDDHAGAVTAQASHEPHKLTTPTPNNAKTKMVAKPAAKSSAPVLRTADQGE